MDRIIITDLRARCIIGVNDDERREKQDVVISIVLYADLQEAGRSDDLRDTVDYKAVKKQVLHLVEHSDFFLIEALAEAVAGICLGPPAVSRTVVRIEKPGALRFAASAGVEIERDKPS